MRSSLTGSAKCVNPSSGPNLSGQGEEDPRFRAGKQTLLPGCPFGLVAALRSARAGGI